MIEEVFLKRKNEIADFFKEYTKEFKDEFEEYLNEIFQDEGVKRDGGYVCYLEDNIKIVEMIPKDKIVVDVGCSFGLQHILYKDHKKYIGIQKFKEGINADKGYNPNFKVFTKNAEIIEGFFKDVSAIEIGWNVENKDQFFGIANHSIFNDLESNKEDIEIFKRLFPQNYYATAEDGTIIKY